MTNIRWRLIAGRGSLGDINWGAAGRSLTVLKSELRELKKHIGQRVLLTGGGGPGGSIATLKSAIIVKEGYMRGMPGLKVYLTNIDPKYGGIGRSGGREAFDPWIDSWQISVQANANPTSLRWVVMGNELFLQEGGIVLAQWNPFQTPWRGAVSVYGVPAGKTFFYKSWHSWKKKVAEVYHMTPPVNYLINPRRQGRRVRFIHVPGYGVHPETLKPVSRKQSVRFRVPAMAMNPQTGFMITPISKKAKSWVKRNVPLEPWQWMGPSFAVEHRFAADLVGGMMESGLVVNKDFRVS